MNHEVYGGIDSQMIFGESFRNRRRRSLREISRRTAANGRWRLANSRLRQERGRNCCSTERFAAGEALVGILFADKVAANAGFILKVNQPGVGADRFTGYEFHSTLAGCFGPASPEFGAASQCPLHRADEQMDQSSVRFTATTLEASVNGRSLLKYEDKDHPLPAGEIGLRTWQRTPAFVICK